MRNIPQIGDIPIDLEHSPSPLFDTFISLIIILASYTIGTYVMYARNHVGIWSLPNTPLHYHLVCKSTWNIMLRCPYNVECTSVVPEDNEELRCEKRNALFRKT